jgi:hypothetical protein
MAKRPRTYVWRAKVGIPLAVNPQQPRKNTLTKLVRAVHGTAAATGEDGSSTQAVRASRSAFWYDPAMSNSPCRSGQISLLILARLGLSESRLLSLLVAIRKDLSGRGPVKGDLGGMVKTALRQLVASGRVIEVDGTYGLSPRA